VLWSDSVSWNDLTVPISIDESAATLDEDGRARMCVILAVRDDGAVATGGNDRHHCADISRCEVPRENEEAVVGIRADRPRLEAAGVVGLDDRLDDGHLAIVPGGGPVLPTSGYPALSGR
jgi:hypothetical protein